MQLVFPIRLLDPVLVSRENINVPADAGFYDDAEAEKPR